LRPQGALKGFEIELSKEEVDLFLKQDHCRNPQRRLTSPALDVLRQWIYDYGNNFAWLFSTQYKIRLGAIAQLLPSCFPAAT